MTLNIGNPSPVMINDQILRHTEIFTYLGSIVTNEGGAENDIKQRLSKARIAFKNLQAVWRSSQYTTRTKLKLYTSCILPTLLYGSECWLMIENDLDRLSVFHTKSLRRILKIFLHLKQGPSQLVPTRGHGPNNYQKTMEMDWTCPQKRAR
jgi:hypothetical protein